MKTAQLLILVFAPAFVLTSCLHSFYKANRGGPQDDEWYYVCDNAEQQKMTWKIRTDEPGEFHFEGGAVLTAVNPRKSRSEFVSQDGQEYMVSGANSLWLFKKAGETSSLVCRRVVDHTLIPLNASSGAKS